MIKILAEILLCVTLVIFILGGIAQIILAVRDMREDIELRKRIRVSSFDKKRSR